METNKKVNSLSFLRFFAVMLVCFCHFANPLVKNNPLAPLFQWFKIYGVHGVQMFFVISGFVIPLSMDKAQYAIKHYFKFLYKRAIRLHPPYLVALAITLVIIALANKAKHIPYPETFVSTLLSCFYLHEPQHIPVFWTLKIEAEYYIFMGLYFVLLKNYPKLTMCLSFPVLLLLSQTALPNYVGLSKHIVFFLVGATGYLIYMKRAPQMLSWAWLSALVAFTFIYHPFGGALAALCTVLFILFFRGEVSPFFNFMGEISYSIYLIHYPIGVKLINVAMKHVNPNYWLALFLGTLVLVITICLAFWKYVEDPFAKLSNKIKYGNKKKVVLASATV